MRAERMIATLLLMQARGRVTAADIAAELEVSVATARRDLEALSAAGVPVYPRPGRGGGWSLVGGSRTDLSGLTAPESQALFLLLGPATSVSADARSAVRKLLRALPGTFQADAEAAAAAVRLDEPGWGEVGRERPAEVDAMQQAVIDRRQVEVDYRNRAGRSSSVTLSPLGLIRKDDIWYLLAVRDGETEVRTYRMDRVASVEATTQPAVRPEDFDLATEWRRVVGYVERQRSLVSATVVVDHRHLPVLRSHFGRYLAVVGDHDGERAVATVAAHTARSVAEQLAGWGAVIEVLEPEAVRAELARIGAELGAAYG
jgi:predicted DNA-binding transcriptional regulator YafY